MKYFGYMPNDFVNGKGVSVSLWTAGCPHYCIGCHNQEMWNYENGYEVPENIEDKICDAIVDNGIQRNLSILGGEPLCLVNIEFVNNIILKVKERFPNIKIYLWTGYTFEELISSYSNVKELESILSNIDVLIDGKFELEKRDVSLPLRGSSNQRILDAKASIKNKAATALN